VRLSLNGVHWAAYATANGTAPTFSLYQEPTILEITHIRARPATGEINITLIGANFLDAPAPGAGTVHTYPPRCFYEPHAVWVAAVIRNSTLVECVLPPLAAHPAMSVSVSIDGVRKGTSNISLIVYDPPRLARIAPELGPIAGGTVIDLYGAGFPLGLSRCVFNDSLFVDPVAMNATWLRCVAPAWSAAVPVRVTVSFYRDQTRTREAKHFNYWSAALDRISPLFGSTNGGLEVHLFGVGMLDLPTIGVRFRFADASPTVVAPSSVDFKQIDALTAPGAWVAHASAWYISPTEIACFTPIMPPSERLLVDFTLNGVDFMGAAQLFRAQPQVALQVDSFFPLLGRSSGSVTLNITGFGFAYGRVVCMFDDVEIAATVYSPTKIMCLTPRLPDQFVSTIRVRAYNNATVWTEAAPFIYTSVAEPSVATTEPLLVRMQGAAAITVVGTDFFNLSSVLCSFGFSADAPKTPFSFINRTAGTCAAPRAEAVFGYLPGEARTTTVTLLYNGLTLAPSISLLTYVVGSPGIVDLTPKIAGGAGDFDVIINGSNFVQSLTSKCRFRSQRMGEVVVGARFVTSSLLVCIAPPTPAGLITVDVTNDGIEYSMQTGTFTSVDMALTNILSIVPTHGPMTGGTFVTATLLVHSEVYQTYRLFSSLSQSAPFIATPVPGMKRRMTFLTPPSTSTPGVPMIIQVSLDDGVTWSPTPVKYTYDPLFLLYSTFPTKVYSNMTRPLTVMGDNFMKDAADTGELLCRFNKTEVVRAAFINSSAIVCQMPFLGTYTGRIAVDVTQNNYQYTAGVFMTIVARPNITDVSPKRFNSDQSLTHMWVFGSGFDSTVRMICRFSSAQLDSTTVPGIFYNETLIRCPIPPMVYTIGNSSLVVSVDDGAFYSLPFELTAEPSIAITSVYPSSGLPTQSMIVWLTGRFLIADVNGASGFGVAPNRVQIIPLARAAGLGAGIEIQSRPQFSRLVVKVELLVRGHVGLENSNNKWNEKNAI
jgi:hypothetical protein